MPGGVFKAFLKIILIKIEKFTSVIFKNRVGINKTSYANS